jgi:hypothetical protein
MTDFVCGLIVGIGLSVFLSLLLTGPRPRPEECEGCEHNPDNYR